MELKRNTHEYIVIVDDEPQVLRSLKWELEIAPLDDPLNIETFDNTNDAIQFIEKNSDDIFLLIADLRMPAPNLTGSDLLMYIHKKFPEIILILLTAYSDLSEIQKAITAEIQALIFKPWTSSLMLAEIVKAKRLYRIKKENLKLQNRIRQQLEYAGEFQRKILQPVQTRPDGIKLELKYEPHSDYHCGGDYYDFIQIADKKELFIIGDVAGHGITPAFITAMLKVITMAIVSEKQEITASGFLSEVNSRLCSTLENVDNIIVTFSVALIDKKKMSFSLSSAGQLPPYIIRGKECIKLNSLDPAMGFDCAILYSEEEIALNFADRIIFFTDGLIESADERRLIPDLEIEAAIKESILKEKPAEFIFNKLREYHTQSKFSDDVTVAVIEFQEN